MKTIITRHGLAAAFMTLTLLFAGTTSARADAKDDEIAKLKAANAALRKELAAAKANGASTRISSTKKSDGRDKRLVKKKDEPVELGIIPKPKMTEGMAGLHPVMVHRSPFTRDGGEIIDAHTVFIKNDLLMGYDGDNRDSILGTIHNAFSALRLRQDTSDLKALEMTLDPENKNKRAASNATVQETEAKPVTFKWNRNNVTGKDGWSADGILYLPFTFVNDSGRPMTPLPTWMPFADTSWMIVYPAIRFNRDSSKDGTDSPVNTLDFLIGADFNFYRLRDTEMPGAVKNFNYVIRAAAGVRTDFSFHHAHALWELSFDPVSEKAGLNVFNYDEADSAISIPHMMHKLTARLLSQITQNVDTPVTVGKVTSGDTEFPLGFQTGLTLTPRNQDLRFLGKVKLSATYTGVFDAKSNYDYSGLFETALEIPFFTGETSQAGWKVGYKNGNDLSTHGRVNETDVSLTVKF